MRNELYNQSQDALKVLYKVIVELIKDHPNGMSNNEITNCLGLESNQEGAQTNYLAYSLLGNLMTMGVIEKYKEGRSSFYRIKR